MKKILIPAALLLLSFGGFAQNAIKGQQVVSAKDKCQKDPNMPVNAKLSWPEGPYVPTQDASCAPCYTYTNKNGLKIMECPYLTFLPPEGAIDRSNSNVAVVGQGSDINVITERSYTGEYPKTCKRDPDMPANAKLAWPKGPYVSLVQKSCAPCYTYKNKRGLEIMECPGLVFLPDDK